MHWTDLEIKWYLQSNHVSWMTCSSLAFSKSANKHQPRLAELRSILFSEWRLSSLSVPLIKHQSDTLLSFTLVKFKPIDLAWHLKEIKHEHYRVLVKLFFWFGDRYSDSRFLFYETHCRPFIIFLSKFFNRMTNRHKHIQCLGRTLQSIVWVLRAKFAFLEKFSSNHNSEGIL